MRVTRYAPSEKVLRGRLNTNTVARLDEVATFTELLEVLAGLRTEHGPARILCTLDDVGQCAYTSGHASEDDRLWFDAGDPDEDDPAAQRRADDARATHVAAALEDPAERVAWDDLPGERLGGEADVAALVAVNRTPDTFLDDVVLVQRAPVSRDDLAVAGLPNGYFTSDWNVFQNHAVIRRMAGHGYRHIGIGASLLGFDRAAAPSAKEAEAVVADLKHLFGAPGAAGWAELAALLPQRPLLLLGYTENFPDMIEDFS
ncbi:hypothetical protein VA596_27000 [Amycolatopsis sp., V23-08]|uniref:Uncharacterized protein n=1 Tax=Amycolatopsis heterodermiae TaxID=3110235 RepID=A0ABU5RAB7_9PSEU|nr:hypothetical protein [Amycolatopsis sp., V23-08]MEA5363207.1 hypothetical protein [Amycolatopsis sp., V23-08]